MPTRRLASRKHQSNQSLNMSKTGSSSLSSSPTASVMSSTWEATRPSEQDSSKMGIGGGEAPQSHSSCWPTLRIWRLRLKVGQIIMEGVIRSVQRYSIYIPSLSSPSQCRVSGTAISKRHKKRNHPPSSSGSSKSSANQRRNSFSKSTSFPAPTDWIFSPSSAS